MPWKTAAVALKVAESGVGAVGSNAVDCDGGGGGGVTVMASSP